MIRIANLGYSVVSVIPSAKGFGSALSKQVNPQLAGAGKSGGKRFGGGLLSSAKSFVAPLAGLFAVSAGVAFFKGAVDGASDLSESASKVGVVFGKQADAIMAASETSAQAMGLSKTAYLNATGGLGNLLVSLEIAPKKAAALSQEMVTLAGDLASFNNASPEEALAALQSGLTGETEPLKRFGVNMNDATLKAQALKMGLIKTTKEAMSPQTKALAAQALIMKQTGTAQGDFARTSDGLANQQRIAAAATDDLKTKIGGFLLPVVTKLTNFITTSVLPAIDGFVEGFKNGTGVGGTFRTILTNVYENGIKPLFDFIVSVALPALQSFGSYITDTIVPALQAMVEWIKQNEGWLIPLAAGVGAVVIAMQVYSGIIAVVRVATAAWAAITGVLNVVLAANPIGLLILAIVAVVAAVTVAYFKFDAFRNIIDSVWSGIQTVVAAVVGFFQNYVMPVLKFVFNAISTYVKVVLTIYKTAWNAIHAAVEFVVGFFQTRVMPVLQFVFNAISTYVKAVLTVYKTVWNGIRAVVETVVDWFSETVWPAIKKVIGFIVDGFVTFKNDVQKKWDAFMGIFTGIGKKFLEIGSAIVNGIKDGIVNAWNAFVNFFKEKIDSLPWFVKKVLGIASPSKVFAEIGANIVDGLQQGIETSFPAVSESSLTIGRGVVSAFVKGMQEKEPEARKAARSAMVDSVQEAFKDTLGKLREGVKTIQDEMQNFAKSVSDSITAGFNFGEAFSGAGDRSAAIIAAQKVVAEAGNSLAEAQAKAAEKDASDADKRGVATAQAALGSAQAALTSAQTAGTSLGTTFMAALTKQAEQAAVFAERVKTVISMKLSQAALQQVIATGTTSGIVIMDGLIAGGVAAITETNDLVSSTQAAADEVGLLAGTNYYGAGLTSAQQMVSAFVESFGPKGNGRTRLMRLMDNLANKMDRTATITVTTINKVISQKVDGERALGGPVWRGGTFLVGEKGPELFQPNLAGNIIPNGSLDMAPPATRKAAVAGAGGGATSADIAALGDRFAAELARQARLIQQLERQG